MNSSLITALLALVPTCLFLGAALFPLGYLFQALRGRVDTSRT
jgi:hypothetical protein